MQEDRPGDISSTQTRRLPGEHGACREGTMVYKILILGASYGSLFATKCLMADHDVTLVCRQATAELINARGTEVRLTLKGETAPRSIFSRHST